MGYRHRLPERIGAEASASNASADVDDDRATRDRAPQDWSYDRPVGVGLGVVAAAWIVTLTFLILMLFA